MGSVCPKYPTYVVIPFKDEIEMTKHVVSLCLEDETVSYVALYDNGSSHESKEQLDDWFATLETERLRCFNAEGMGIYQMWNAGWQFAVDNENRGPSNIAFLNNDIHFLPGTIDKLVNVLRRCEDALVTYPDYDRPTSEGISPGQQVRLTFGTKKDGGMCGHFFVIRGEAAKKGLPMFDEDFGWWCGDDAFAKEVERYPASQYRVVGWPCDHVNEATASNGHNDWTHESKSRDLELFAAKWG